MMFSVFLCAGIQCSSGDSCSAGTHSDSSETVGGKSQSQPPEQGDYYYYMHAMYTQVHSLCLEVTYTPSSIRVGYMQSQFVYSLTVYMGTVCLVRYYPVAAHAKSRVKQSILLVCHQK